MEQDEFMVKITYRKIIGRVILICSLLLGGILMFLDGGEPIVAVFLIFLFLLFIYGVQRPIAIISRKGIKMSSQRGILNTSGKIFIPWSSVRKMELATGFFEKMPYWMPNQFSTKSYYSKEKVPVKYIAIFTDKRHGYVTLTKGRKQRKVILPNTPSAYIFNEFLASEQYETILEMMKKYQTDYLAQKF